MSKPTSSRPASSLMDLTSGQLMSYAVGGIYLSSTPIASYLSKTKLIQQYVPSLFSNLLKINESKTIVALGGIYFLVAYPLSGGLSIFGQSLNRNGGYSNREPRTAQTSLTGLARRCVSTHQNLMETFPAFAFVALMTQVLAPESKELKALLTLHVLLKTVVFPAAYVTDFDLIRSSSHILSIGALCSALLKLVYA